MLTVSIKRADQGGEHGVTLSVDLPPDTEAHISMPVTKAGAKVMVNGKAESGTLAEGGSRKVVVLNQGGHFDLSTQ
jgi:hypothetical protein